MTYVIAGSYAQFSTWCRGRRVWPSKARAQGIVYLPDANAISFMVMPDDEIVILGAASERHDFAEITSALESAGWNPTRRETASARQVMDLR